MRDASTRDDGLRRVSRITRVAAATGVGASVLFAAVVAHAAPGRSPSSAGTGASTSSAGTGASTAGSGSSSGSPDVGSTDVTPADPALQAPAQAPSRSFSRPQVSSGAS